MSASTCTRLSLQRRTAEIGDHRKRQLCHSRWCVASGSTKQARRALRRKTGMNSKMRLRMCFGCLLAMISLSHAGERGVVDTATSPFAQIRTIGLDEVRWTDGFWAGRFELCRTQMIPSMGRLMEG